MPCRCASNEHALHALPRSATYERLGLTSPAAGYYYRGLRRCFAGAEEGMVVFNRHVRKD
jgi:hypothetical protein